MFRRLFPFLPPVAAIPVMALFASTLVTRVSAAPLYCIPSTVPLVVHGEGITERTGDMVFDCSGGSPSATVTLDLAVFLNVNITNRLTSSSSNTLEGITVTADTGTGPQAIPATPALTGVAAVSFNGITFTLSSSGTVTLRIAGLRGDANLLDFAPGQSMQALIGLEPSDLFLLTSDQLLVGQPEHGLYIDMASELVCTQAGSPSPANTGSYASFIGAGTALASTRLTEGFADSFAPKSDPSNLNADTGTRFVIQYSGFPAGAQIYVPTVVAGSDAAVPTSGGDLGLPVSGGQYMPGASSLLLSFVAGADSNGAGGTPAYFPGAPGSGIALFDGMSQVMLANGSGIAVYEVVDANPSLQESAQFPTFLTVPGSGDGLSSITSESVSLGPISTVYTATASDPIPRFQQIMPPSDCVIVGGCQDVPALTLTQTSLTYTAPAGGMTQTNYVQVENSSGGLLQWTTAVSYANGTGWLNVSPPDGQNAQMIRIDAVPGTLAPGTYQATLTVNAGPLAGTRNVAISFVITAPVAPVPAIQSAVNSATFASGPLAPGSFATLVGSGFSGQNLTVTFNNIASEVVFSNATQINLIVPSSLPAQTNGKSTAQVVVSVDGVAGAAFTVNLAPFAPGIFQPGVLNQNNTVNSATEPAAPGSVIQVFATGLSGTGVITATIGSEAVTQPYYGGPAPDIPGLQQVDLMLPSNLTGSSVNIAVCGGPTTTQTVCSPPVAVAIGQ
jgi:uncharacterized protein (TIGR03437 family)